MDTISVLFEGREKTNNIDDMLREMQSIWNINREDAIALAFNLGIAHNCNPDSDAREHAEKQIERLMVANSASPKEGYVYFIKARDRNLFKIGVTRSTPRKRLPTLQSGCPYDLEIYADLYYYDCYAREKEFHGILSLYRTRGEWFDVSPEIIDELIVQELIKGDLSKRSGDTPVMSGYMDSTRSAYLKALDRIGMPPPWED